MRKYFYIAISVATIMIGCGSESGSTMNSSGTGKGGSMARFTIQGDKLYTINNRYINAFDISQPDTPSPDISQPVPWDVETLYSYDNYLYVGAQSGVYIYNHELEKVGEFTHTKSCDPVVIQDGVAFVTLSSGSSCRLDSGENTIEFLDVRDPLNPTFIGKKNMFHPTGLGIDGEKLFVCDGAGGLKLFDVNITKNSETNRTSVALTYNRTSSYPDLLCYDVIAHKELLVVSADKEVKQFDYSHLPMVPLGDIK
jgi:hypothetical protein